MTQVEYSTARRPEAEVWEPTASVLSERTDSSLPLDLFELGLPTLKPKHPAFITDQTTCAMVRRPPDGVGSRSDPAFEFVDRAIRDALRSMMQIPWPSLSEIEPQAPTAKSVQVAIAIETIERGVPRNIFEDED